MKKRERTQDFDVGKSPIPVGGGQYDQPSQLGLSTMLYCPLTVVAIAVALLSIYVFVHSGWATSITGKPQPDPYTTPLEPGQSLEDRAWRNLDMPDVTLARAHDPTDQPEQAYLGERALDMPDTRLSNAQAVWDQANEFVEKLADLYGRIIATWYRASSQTQP